jgi:hypothetical protein
VLYKKAECTFCKASSDNLIFTSETDKDYLSFHGEDIPYRDERLKIYFESQQARDETLVLLHFNCPDASCDYVGANWPDLKGHVRSEHGRMFCELCVRNSRIFVHEHTLRSASELAQHIRADHKHCEFCRMDFYSDDELYVHMRDRHEQCFICKRHDESSDEYHKDYAALERHFRKRHYLCDSKQCLEQKFVVFESEMDFKAHQVSEHGAELTSRERREALRVTANFEYHPNSSQARAEVGGQSGPGHSGRGQQRDDNDAGPSSISVPLASRDPLGLSPLASRTYVPGAGGPANHQSRRAQFGSGLTSARKIKESEEAAAHNAAEQERLRRQQALTSRVAEIVGQSEVKMHSFRANLKTFQAGEMNARDLIDLIRGIIPDSNQAEEIVKKIVETLESADQQQHLLDALTTAQVEQTHFPSLGGSSNAGMPSVTRGQVRTIKNSSVAANRGIWANVERAAASGGSVYRNVATRSSGPSIVRSTSHFPSLSTNKSVVPGSALHASRVNTKVAASSGAPPSWGASAASSSGRNTPTASAAPAVMKPYSVDATRNPQRNNQTSVKSNSAAFPALPVNADAARLAAQKRKLFEHKRSGANNSGTATPNGPIWSPTNIGRIDGGSGSESPFGGPDDFDADHLSEQLSGALHFDNSTSATANNSAGSRKGKPQKKVLVSMGGVHRG